MVHQIHGMNPIAAGCNRESVRAELLPFRGIDWPGAGAVRVLVQALAGTRHRKHLSGREVASIHEMDAATGIAGYDHPIRSGHGDEILWTDRTADEPDVAVGLAAALLQCADRRSERRRSEEHTSELQSQSNL